MGSSSFWLNYWRSKTIKLFLVGLLGYLPNISLAAAAWFSCSPVNVAVFFGSRVHVQCSSGYGANGSFIYFALPAVASSDMQQANELQSMAMTAMTAGKQLSLYFDDADTSGVSFGCGTNDCRKLLGIVMLK